jgi:hypothetical protein
VEDRVDRCEVGKVHRRKRVAALAHLVAWRGTWRDTWLGTWRGVAWHVELHVAWRGTWRGTWRGVARGVARGGASHAVGTKPITARSSYTASTRTWRECSAASTHARADSADALGMNKHAPSLTPVKARTGIHTYRTGRGGTASATGPAGNGANASMRLIKAPIVTRVSSARTHTCL